MRWRVLGVGLVSLLALAATADVVWYHNSLPDLEPLRARTARYDARVRRDKWGVPHVLGRRDADAAFGLGYAHSEDDFDTIRDVTLAMRGQLAAERGKSAAVGDYLVHLFRIWPTLEAHYGELPADVRAVMEGYADGVNAYAARHPEKAVGGLLPVTGRDIAAGFMFKTPFFYGLDDVLKGLSEPRRAATGSNGVAVAPSRSTDGATRLLVNSHQPYTGPVAWYEAVVESGQGWHVAGGFFPGAPFMLHGHNAHLGWANTVNQPKLADVYRLTLDPADPDRYRLDGQWRHFTHEDAAITVRLWGPFRWTVHRDVLWSAHGPVLKTPHGAFAVRYAGMGEWRQPAQYWRLNRAGDAAAWREAMALGALPSINYIYADETGTIGYVYNGQFPNRPDVPGVDWCAAELPGDRSDLIWQGYLPFARVPQIWKPSSGYVFNSNNTPFVATGAADALKREDFPARMCLQTDMTNRAYRVQETFGADAHISAEAFRRYKYDVRYSRQSSEWAIVQAAIGLDAGADADMKAAQAILRGWDGSADRNNRAAALAVLTVLPAEVAALHHAPAPPVADSLRAAIATLKAHFGRLDPTWGEVNRLRRGAVDLPLDGGPDTFRAVWSEADSDGRRHGVAGDTLIMFVTWDAAGKLSSGSVHQFGSATLDAASPHFSDQAKLFAAEQIKPVLFTEAALAGHVEADYRPGVDR